MNKELILESVDKWFNNKDSNYRYLTDEEILCIQVLNKKIRCKKSKEYLKRIKIKEGRYISFDIMEGERND